MCAFSTLSMSTLWVLHGRRAISPDPSQALQPSALPGLSSAGRGARRDAGGPGSGRRGRARWPALWHTSSPPGRGADGGQGDFRRGEAAAPPVHGPLVAQGEAGRPARSKMPSSALSYGAGGEAKAPLRIKQGEQEAWRRLLRRAATRHQEQDTSVLHSPSHHQRAINAHVCSFTQARAASRLIPTSVFSLDWHRVRNEQFFQLISLL